MPDITKKRDGWPLRGLQQQLAKALASLRVQVATSGVIEREGKRENG
jgi:hypothetical protein